MDTFLILLLILGIILVVGGTVSLILYVCDNYPGVPKEFFLGIMKPLKGHKIVERWREEHGTATDYWFKCECGDERGGNIITVFLEHVDHKDSARSYGVQYSDVVKKKGWLG